MDQTWLMNLWSGIFGAVVGAVVSVAILILTNRYTRKVASEQAEQDRARFEEAQLAARRNFEEQLLADQGRFDAERAESRDQLEVQRSFERDLARETREIEAIADLVTFLQSELFETPTSLSHLPRVMALTNLLTLNSSSSVAGEWDKFRPPRPFPVRIRRHPLARALVAWTSAVELVRKFPAPQGMGDRGGVSPAVILAGAEDASSQIRDSVAEVVSELLRWPDLAHEEKVKAFDGIIMSATSAARRARFAVNFLLGAADWREEPMAFVVNQPELLSLYEATRELRIMYEGGWFRKARETWHAHFDGVNRHEFDGQSALALVEDASGWKVVRLGGPSPRQLWRREIDADDGARVWRQKLAEIGGNPSGDQTMGSGSTL